MASTNMNHDLVQTNPAITGVPVDETTKLTGMQMTAVDALLLGKSITHAAAAAGVARGTLYNWLRQNSRFQAALNRGRRELQQAVGYRIEQMAADAAECVSGAIQKGDVKAALEVLKRTGALAPANIGSDDELILHLQEHERNEERDSRVKMAEDLFGFQKALPEQKQLPRAK